MEPEAQETTVSLNVLLPRSTQDFIEREIAEGGYSTPSDYIRALVEEAHSRKAEERLEKLLLEGLDSGPATPMTRADWEEIKRRGLERINQQQA